MVDDHVVLRDSSSTLNCTAHAAAYSVRPAVREQGKNPVASDPNPKPAAQQGALSFKRPAAGYLRSATELTGDALHKQIEAIVRYARDHRLQLIRLYCDECGSGLRIDGRTGLQQMFRDIENGGGDFDTILLLDPSRWGRFQDPDQSACLEYACERARIEVRYCAEQHLADDELAFSEVVQAIKRIIVGDDEHDLATHRHRAAGDIAAHDVAGNLPEEDDGGRPPVT